MLAWRSTGCATGGPLPLRLLMARTDALLTHREAHCGYCGMSGDSIAAASLTHSVLPVGYKPLRAHLPDEDAEELREGRCEVTLRLAANLGHLLVEDVRGHAVPAQAADGCTMATVGNSAMP